MPPPTSLYLLRSVSQLAIEAVSFCNAETDLAAHDKNQPTLGGVRIKDFDGGHNALLQLLPPKQRRQILLQEALAKTSSQAQEPRAKAEQKKALDKVMAKGRR